MTQDRLDVMKQVLYGNLSDEYVTLEEVLEAKQMVEEAVMDKLLDSLSKTNPSTFFGVDNSTLN